MSVNHLSVKETDSLITFFKNDEVSNGERIWSVNGKHRQIVRVLPERELDFAVYNHDDDLIRDLCEGFVESTGLRLPNAFLAGTYVYNVNGLLKLDGVQVPMRVLRQQVFLSGNVVPITIDDTYWHIYHGLGNALWNFLDHKVWTEDNSAKDRYREIRGLPPLNKGDNKKYQHRLFYIASEDFRYLFGSAIAGREQWTLSHGPRPIGPPPPSTIDFWKQEIAKYGRNQSQETEAEVPIQREVVSATQAPTTGR